MKGLEEIFTEMLNYIDDHKEAYNKPQWTNEAIVKTWIKTNEHKLKNLFIPIFSKRLLEVKFIYLNRTDASIHSDTFKAETSEEALQMLYDKYGYDVEWRTISDALNVC